MREFEGNRLGNDSRKKQTSRGEAKIQTEEHFSREAFQSKKVEERGVLGQ